MRFPLSLYADLKIKVRDYKRVWWEICPNAQSAHLTEAVAAGFGFKTHAALLAHIRVAEKDDLVFDAVLCEDRLKEIQSA